VKQNCVKTVKMFHIYKRRKICCQTRNSSKRWLIKELSQIRCT